MVKTRQGEEERGKWGQINIKYIEINMQSNTGRHTYTDSTRPERAMSRCCQDDKCTFQ